MLFTLGPINHNLLYITKYDFKSRYIKSSFDHRVILDMFNTANKRVKKMWSTKWEFFNEPSHWLYWYRVQTSLISLSGLDSVQLSRHLHCKQICELIYICQTRSSSEKLTGGICLQEGGRGGLDSDLSWALLVKTGCAFAYSESISIWEDKHMWLRVYLYLNSNFKSEKYAVRNFPDSAALPEKPCHNLCYRDAKRL